mmetsp:Transcript_52111/g.108794  ORF Transcript_52111/g.108794 Transcript_52111/m.108794 type:complete len:119 (-) Transcript_52111:260-616(-)
MNISVARRLCGCSAWLHRASESVPFLPGMFVDSPLPHHAAQLQLTPAPPSLGAANAILWRHVLSCYLYQNLCTPEKVASYVCTKPEEYFAFFADFISAEMVVVLKPASLYQKTRFCGT